MPFFRIRVYPVSSDHQSSCLDSSVASVADCLGCTRRKTSGRHVSGRMCNIARKGRGVSRKPRYPPPRPSVPPQHYCDIRIFLDGMGWHCKMMAPRLATESLGSSNWRVGVRRLPVTQCPTVLMVASKGSTSFLLVSSSAALSVA